MLMGLPDLFLCQWCQTWLSSEPLQAQGEQVQERLWNIVGGRAGTLGVPPHIGSPMLT